MEILGSRTPLTPETWRQAISYLGIKDRLALSLTNDDLNYIVTGIIYRNPLQTIKEITRSTSAATRANVIKKFVAHMRSQLHSSDCRPTLRSILILDLAALHACEPLSFQECSAIVKKATRLISLTIPDQHRNLAINLPSASELCHITCYPFEKYHFNAQVWKKLHSQTPALRSIEMLLDKSPPLLQVRLLETTMKLILRNVKHIGIRWLGSGKRMLLHDCWIDLIANHSLTSLNLEWCLLNGLSTLLHELPLKHLRLKGVNFCRPADLQSLYATPTTTETAQSSITARPPTLRTLKIIDCTNITLADLNAFIGHHASTIKVLRLKLEKQISLDYRYDFLKGEMPALRKLALPFEYTEPYFFDTFIEMHGKQLSHLRLDYSPIQTSTNFDHHHVIRNCSNLQCITLAGCDLYSVMSDFATSLPYLHTIKAAPTYQQYLYGDAILNLALKRCQQLPHKPLRWKIPKQYHCAEWYIKISLCCTLAGFTANEFVSALDGVIELDFGLLELRTEVGPKPHYEGPVPVRKILEAKAPSNSSSCVLSKGRPQTEANKPYPSPVPEFVNISEQKKLSSTSLVNEKQRNVAPTIYSQPSLPYRVAWPGSTLVSLPSASYENNQSNPRAGTVHNMYYPLPSNQILGADASVPSLVTQHSYNSLESYSVSCNGSRSVTPPPTVVPINFSHLGLSINSNSMDCVNLQASSDVPNNQSYDTSFSGSLVSEVTMSSIKNEYNNITAIDPRQYGPSTMQAHREAPRLCNSTSNPVPATESETQHALIRKAPKRLTLKDYKLRASASQPLSQSSPQNSDRSTTTSQYQLSTVMDPRMVHDGGSAYESAASVSVLQYQSSNILGSTFSSGFLPYSTALPTTLSADTRFPYRSITENDKEVIILD
ncbi:hypothetical protein SeMB42_g05533 [Synchytrium endobioticum]|uniref:Uncharacterized protein n=1 Tax=Synchytrium endobioticum TaxID=286115 RepID=A0A507CKT3_9FUNG|nr:hypothetical protein SeLEV6574_g06608 [Synchytrium endobioticum]TPX41543.1 hypothetical protein SeMB42_g05533 [Synchytrium endobioticum]